MIKNIVKNNKGNSLIIVVSIMTVFLSIIFSFSKLFLDTLKSSKNSSNKYISKYASESGAERVFYLINSSGLTFENIISNSTYNNYTFENGAKYLLESNNSEAFYIKELAMWDTHTIDINKTSDFNRVKSIKVDWEEESPFQLMEISLDFYKNGKYNRTVFVNHYFSTNTPIIINLSFPNDPKTSTYKLNFESINSDIHNMSLTFYNQNNGNGTPVILDSIQGLQSTGTFLDNKQSINVDSTLLDYFQ